MRTDRAGVLAAAALLASSGLVLLAAAALHPRIPADLGAQARLAGSWPAWGPVHWVLTFAQLGAALGAVARWRSLGPGTVGPVTGTALVAVTGGLAAGAAGTLLSATALRAAAHGNDTTVFAVAAALTVSAGWLGMVVASAGGVVVSAVVVRGARAPLVRAAGGVALAGTAATLVAAFWLAPTHAATHSVLLPAAAAGLGAACLVAAAEALAPA